MNGTDVPKECDRMITRIRIDSEGSDMPTVDAEIAKVEGLLWQSGLITELGHAHITEEVFERIPRGNNVGDGYKGRRTTSFKPA